MTLLDPRRSLANLIYIGYYRKILLQHFALLEENLLIGRSIPQKEVFSTVSFLVQKVLESPLF
ncbi:hypothetical protein LINGRAPRIM_LOCUS3327 [Linum grandiflorum]